MRVDNHTNMSKVKYRHCEISLLSHRETGHLFTVGFCIISYPVKNKMLPYRETKWQQSTGPVPFYPCFSLTLLPSLQK